MRSKFSYSLNLSPTKYHPDLNIFANGSHCEIKAHRAVLASHSYMLKTAFLSSDVEGEAVIILPDFSLEDVNQMIQLLYGQISEIKITSEIFSVLGLSPSSQESDYFVDHDESELIFETIKSEIIEEDGDAPVKRPRSKPKVYTDTSTNLVNNEGAVAIDVDAYIVNEPLETRPWLCQLCLLAGAKNPHAKNPYRSMHKHNLKYHIMKKHFKMEIPKNWKCDLCARKFISRSGLRQHKRDTCPMSLQSVASSDTSIRAGQEMESRTPTPCDEPDSDVESVAGSTNQMFECATCCNIFESIKEIQKHMQDCGGGVQEEEQVMYQCNECWEAGQEFIFPSMVELNNHIQSEHNDGDTSIDDNKSQIHTIEIPTLIHDSESLEQYIETSKQKFEGTRVIESLPQHIETPRLESETFAKEIDIINEDVLIEEIEESVTVEVHVNQEDSNNIIEESVLEEEVVGNDNLMMVDDFDNQVVENPDIDTTEVLIQCEPSEISVDNANEITLVMVDENDNPVFCPVCNNGFSTPELLTEHLTHHPSCPTCGEMVLSNTVLSLHLGTHPLCGVCGDRFADIDVLEKHEQNHADIEQAIRGDSDTIGLKYQNPEIRDAICSIQSAPVIVNDDFIDGRKSAELIQEANPGFTIGNLDVSQDLDISSLLAQQNIRAQCDLCEKTFSNETVLDMHIQGAHGGYIQPVQNQESPKFQLEILENMINCNFCQESFSSMTELNTHTAAVHREILEATQLVSAAQHVNSQEQVAVRENVPPFNCTLCKDSFLKVGHLSKHINLNHKINKLDSGKPFRCKICSSNFLQLSTLDKHMLVQHHGQEHLYDCPECSKTFKYSASLQQHLRIHSAVRLYQCGSCTRTFNWEASLRTHIKKCDGGHVHETIAAKKRKITEKPEVNIEIGLGADPLTVKCSRCGELFSDQGQFSGHICPGNRGRGRRYRCGKCHLLFRSRRKIRRHLRSCMVGKQEGEEVKEDHGPRLSKRQRKAVKDDQFVSDIEGSDKELEDLVDSDAEEEFKVNEKEKYAESSDDSDGSSGDEQDDFTTEPKLKSYTVEKLDNDSSKMIIPVIVDKNDNPALTKPRKTYTCEYCEREFKFGHHLKEHIICHTGIYPFNCEECGKGFRRRLELGKHCCSDPINTRKRVCVSDPLKIRKRRVSVIQKTPIDLEKSSSPALLTEKIQTHVCKVCELSFDKQQKYASHFRSSPMCRGFTVKIAAKVNSEEVAEMDNFNVGLFNCSVCQFSTDNGVKFTQHLETVEHVDRGLLEEFNSSMAKYKCELCFFTADTEYKYKRHLVTKKHLENEEARTEEELSEKLRNPKIYSCLVCEKPFKDLISLDEHVEEHKKDEELTSRSGRKIKLKKFHDDLSVEGLKRKAGDEAKATKVKKVKRSVGLDTSQDSCAGTGVECGICGDNFSSHTAHFIHMLSHVPPEIVKTLPVVEGGGVGWCPHCPGPVQLEMVEQHMLELHNEMEEGEPDLGLKIGEKKLEFDEIDPEELEALELPDSERCVPKRLPG